ncbi:MAG: cysteine desulfurase [Spirochaetes bacterium]|nr:cysteine desulfurase [Spirochaetota bacterium]
MPFDPNVLRRDFPILKKKFSASGKESDKQIPLVYLDNASATHKPRQVMDAVKNYYEESNSNVHRAIHKLGEKATYLYEESRKKIAGFINAESANEIIFTRGATESINLAASSWGRKFLVDGDEIILSEMEHHSNLIPWQQLSIELGVKLKFIPFLENGTLDLSKLESLFSDRTRLVAVTQMSNVFGTINNVKEIIRFSHSRNVSVFLDGAQSVSHIPVDVKDLDCDFLAASGHKMCGPTGIGFLYVKRKWLDQMPPYQFGGEMIGSVWLDRAEWAEIPYKFEAGTPNVAGAIGLGSAIDYLSKIGMKNIHEYEIKLTAYAREKLKEISDLKIFGNPPEQGGVLSFYLGKIHPHDVGQFLDNEGIAVRAGHHCAQPLMRKLAVPATVRASFYFYNTHEEIDKLVEGIIKVRKFFNHGI